MTSVIDLGSELLIDRSQVRDPYMQLLLTALGQELSEGSAWIAVEKCVASLYEPVLSLIDEQLQLVAA